MLIRIVIFSIAFLLASTIEAELNTDLFIITVNTENEGNSCNSCFEIPTHPDELYEYDIDWGNNGSWDLGLGGNATHDFIIPGVYQIAIRGVFPRIYFDDDGDAEKLISIDQWGHNPWTSMEDAFRGCSNLAGQASDNPMLDSVSSLSNMFLGADIFHQYITQWDVDSITDMSGLFQNTDSFNQDLAQWEVINVTDMSAMFSGAKSFNQDISQWKVDNVTNMRFLFSYTDSFNQDLSEWNVSQVTDMTEMFGGSESFNEDITTWDVSSVMNMSFMFYQSESFNQDISEWDVCNVTDMADMFSGAEVFNQDISEWDVTNVVDMSAMFFYADSFNQDISKWNFNPTVTMSFMLSNSGLDVNNYDKFLISVRHQNLPLNTTLGAEGLKFCNSFNERQYLIDNNSWNIVGDGPLGINFNSFQVNTGNWHGAKTIWLQDHYPTKCDAVIVSNNRNVTVTSSDVAYGRTLRIDLGSTMEVVLGAEMEIGAN